MLLEAQRRGHDLIYMEQSSLGAMDGDAFGTAQSVSVKDDPANWYELGSPSQMPLADLDVILMRKDPPFNMQYIYSTYLLELAENAGVLVVNRPQALRDANEKLYTAQFAQCCVPMLVSRDATAIREFVNQHGKAVIKPLDGMGGESIFQLRSDDLNLNVIMETVSDNGRELVMAQKYIDEISSGDKRILLIDGEPVPYALARLPGKGDFRGNLAKGGKGVGVELSERDLWICSQVGPELKRNGILFSGLDVIGDYLTEINVTSPTGIRELDDEFDLNIAGLMFDAIETRVSQQ